MAGENLLLMHGVTVGETRPGLVPRLGDDVSVGADAVIIGGISVGDRVHVGAGAVVVHDVPADTTVAGVPAKPVGRSAALASTDETTSSQTAPRHGSLVK